MQCIINNVAVSGFCLNSEKETYFSVSKLRVNIKIIPNAYTQGNMIFILYGHVKMN